MHKMRILLKATVLFLAVFTSIAACKSRDSQSGVKGNDDRNLPNSWIDRSLTLLGNLKTTSSELTVAAATASTDYSKSLIDKISSSLSVLSRLSTELDLIVREGYEPRARGDRDVTYAVPLQDTNLNGTIIRGIVNVHKDIKFLNASFNSLLRESGQLSAADTVARTNALVAFLQEVQKIPPVIDGIMYDINAWKGGSAGSGGGKFISSWTDPQTGRLWVFVGFAYGSDQKPLNQCGNISPNLRIANSDELLAAAPRLIDSKVNSVFGSLLSGQNYFWSRANPSTPPCFGDHIDDPSLRYCQGFTDRNANLLCTSDSANVALNTWQDDRTGYQWLFVGQVSGDSSASPDTTCSKISDKWRSPTLKELREVTYRIGDTDTNKAFGAKISDTMEFWTRDPSAPHARAASFSRETDTFADNASGRDDVICISKDPVAQPKPPAPCINGSKPVIGAWWLMGTSYQSCDTVCGARSLKYDLATNLAGGGQGPENVEACKQVAAAFNVSSPYTERFCGSNLEIYQSGCINLGTTLTICAPSNPAARGTDNGNRFCACK